MDKAIQLIKTVIIVSILAQVIPMAIKYRAEIKGAAREFFGSAAQAIQNVKE
jgi:hypothetical protein